MHVQTTSPATTPDQATNPDAPQLPDVGTHIELNMRGHRPTAFLITAHTPGGFTAEIAQAAPKGKRWDLRAVPNFGTAYWGNQRLQVRSRTTKRLHLHLIEQ